MKRWQAILCILIVPTLMVVGFVIWIGIAASAIMSAGSWANAQAHDPDAVVLPPFIKYWAPLKLARVAQLNPEIIFIGTSRCQEFRSAMLKPYRAYNACLSAWTLDQNIELLRRIFAASHPRVVIIALDYFLFTDVWEEGYRKERAGDFNRYSQTLGGISDTFVAFRKHPRQTLDLALDAAGAPHFDSRDHNRLLGIEAIRTGAGFRYDGAFLLPAGQIANAPETGKDLKLFMNAFPGGTEVSPHQIERLKTLADLVQKNGATLIGIQLPIFKDAITYLERDEEYRPYSGLWKQFESRDLQERISAMGIHFFDLARDPVSENSAYFVDPVHAGETGILCALAGLAENPDFKGIFPALEGNGMRQTCASATANGQFFDVYHNEF